jgi:hypothetical protein
MKLRLEWVDPSIASVMLEMPVRKGTVMGIVPRTNEEKISFFQSHLEAWAEEAEAIGLSAERVAELAALTEAARAASAAQRVLQQQAQSATAVMNEAIARMMKAGSNAINLIRTTASINGGEVYSKARIPPIARKLKRPPPGTPHTIQSSVDAVGSVELRWRCENPRGTMGTTYQVWRRMGRAGDWVFVGASGEKRFVDDALPTGSSEVYYRVQATRSNTRSGWATGLVCFGTATPKPAGAMGEIQRRRHRLACAA